MRSEMTVNTDWCAGGRHEVSAGVMMTQLLVGWTCPLHLFASLWAETPPTHGGAR